MPEPALNADYECCPRCGASTVESNGYLLCRSIGCPWFLTLADGKEHFRA